MLFELFLLVAAFIGSAIFGFIFVGGLGYLAYVPVASDVRRDVTLVVPTVASSHVRDTLFETIEYHTTEFPESDLIYVIDEGADLQEELRNRDGIEVVVVPDSYDPLAVAKGRAMQYFVDHHVEESEWYAFLDDDNKLLDDTFMYEIPVYEAEGYRVTNPVLVPRPGESRFTYVMDWVRTLDDLLVFRFFTGLIGSPHMGFHGELLCARGDILKEVGFERETIVEDFAFAAEVVKRDIPTWQTQTRVSVLSPHTIRALYEQRSRWWRGLVKWLPNCDRLTQIMVGSRLLIWTSSIIGGWAMIFVWTFLVQGITIPPLFFVVPIINGIVYTGAYLYGIYFRVREDRSWSYLLVIPLIPLLSTLEQASAIYAMFQFNKGFTVIKK